MKLEVSGDLAAAVEFLIGAARSSKIEFDVAPWPGEGPLEVTGDVTVLVRELRALSRVSVRLSDETGKVGQ